MRFPAPTHRNWWLWKIRYRWREFVCAVVGHRWYYGVDKGDGTMDWMRKRFPAERKWCGRCGRHELNL